MPTLKSLLTLIVVGLIAGFLAGVITRRDRRGFGVAGNLIVGVVGALLGGFVFNLVGLTAHTFLGRLIFALAGALGFAWLLRFIKR